MGGTYDGARRRLRLKVPSAPAEPLVDFALH
jgi:hypothetical protein